MVRADPEGAMRTCVLFVALLVACDSTNEPGTDPTTAAADTSVAEDVAAVVIPDPPEGGQQLLTDEYTLQGGEEKYFCYTFESPPDPVGIVHVDNISGQLVHHVALFQHMVGDEPPGFHECNVLIRVTWMPIWAGGTGGNDLTVPDGVAFKIAPKTQYVVQYHLLNATPDPITERSAINLSYVRDLDNYQPAGIFALGSFNLTIPKDARDFTQDTECHADQELNVFAVFPHMHQIGKKLEVFSGSSPEDLAVTYKIDPWPFGDQPFDAVDFKIDQGQFLRARCTWDNETGHDVEFGESSFDEMCFTVLFAYPMPEINGCGFD